MWYTIYPIRTYPQFYQRSRFIKIFMVGFTIGLWFLSSQYHMTILTSSQLSALGLLRPYRCRQSSTVWFDHFQGKTTAFPMDFWARLKWSDQDLLGIYPGCTTEISVRSVGTFVWIFMEASTWGFLMVSASETDFEGRNAAIQIWGWNDRKKSTDFWYFLIGSHSIFGFNQLAFHEIWSASRYGQLLVSDSCSSMPSFKLINHTHPYPFSVLVVCSCSF